MAKRNQKFVFWILGILFFLNVLAWIVVFDLARPQFLEVCFFDVGQGEAIFIETPKRHQILIDGGPNSAILKKLAKEMPFWDRTIDLVILSHPERDHLIGLLEVLKRYKIENILWTGVVRDTLEYKEWQRLMRKEGAEIFIAKAGQKILWDSNSDHFITILYPFSNLEGQKFENSNDTSIVAKLIFGKNSFLFTGDATKLVEKELLKEGMDVDSDILKVGHHGSKTSSSEEFIKEVSPEIAIISVGKNNSYGHPHQEVLERLRKYGITVWRTDRDKDIKIISDGVNYFVKI